MGCDGLPRASAEELSNMVYEAARVDVES
jgi:hypothetical protein